MGEYLSAKDLMKIGLRGYKEFVSVNWHGKIINVKMLLSREEELSLIHRIVSSCYDEELDVIIPDVVDFCIKSNIVSAYSLIELPEDIEDRYTLLYFSDLYEYVTGAACEKQILHIIDTVNTYTRYK